MNTHMVPIESTTNQEPRFKSWKTFFGIVSSSARRRCSRVIGVGPIDERCRARTTTTAHAHRAARRGYAYHLGTDALHHTAHRIHLRDCPGTLGSLLLPSKVFFIALNCEMNDRKILFLFLSVCYVHCLLYAVLVVH